MIIRKATLSDLNMVTDLYMNSVEAMNRNQIYQWDEKYPTKTILENDILMEQMYVGLTDDIIVSAVVINHDFDSQYSSGNWLYSNDKYVIIHRLCVNPTYQNQKIGKNTMLLMEEILRQNNILSTRLDAFSLNPYALKLYESLGYHKVGEITLRKGLFNLYEKIL